MFLLKIIRVLALWGILYYGSQFLIMFFKAMYPRIMHHFITETNRNPEALMNNLRSDYYGFNDIDIVMYECNFLNEPYMRVEKNNHYVLYVPEEARYSDDVIARWAIACKIKAKYGVTPSLDKPIQWFSVLCYLLDGNDFNISKTEWKPKDENS